MNSALLDLRTAARSLLHRPGFAAAVVVSLGLGIGANTAIFSLIDGTLRKPLPVPDPDRIVALYKIRPDAPDPANYSHPDFVDYRRELSGVFEELFGHGGVPLSLAGSGAAEMLWGERVTSTYFSGLGLRPAAGRFFTPQDLSANPDRRLAVLAYAAWQRHFGGDPRVVGSTVRLNGESWDVVGVAPRGFSGVQLLAFAPDFWLPVTAFAAVDPGSEGMIEDRTWRGLRLYGRLLPGVSIAQAEEAANALAVRLAETYPDELIAGTEVHVISSRTRTEVFLHHAAGGKLKLGAAALMAAVGFVLLVACANVANLLLARAGTRGREMAVRAALGSGRWRLVRYVLSEGVLLALAGGALGVLIGGWLKDLFLLAAPTLEYPVDFGVSLDGRVLAFTGFLSLITVVVFALVPAWRGTRPDLVSGFHREATAGRSASGLLRPRSLFVIGQVALSLVLLVVAGLFLRSLGEVRRTDPGFALDRAVMLSINPEVVGYDGEQTRQLADTIRQRIGGLPGVSSVSLAAPLPLDVYSRAAEIVPAGFEPGPDRAPPRILTSCVAPDYFETVGTTLVAGRGFTDADRSDAPPVAVVNQAFAERYWPGKRALGERFQFGSGGPWVSVVGVAADGKYQTLAESSRPYVFFPLAQWVRPQLRVLVSSQGDPLALVPRVRQELRAIDPDLPVFAARTMAEHLERSLAAHQALASIVGLFAVLAAVLAGLGIFGVMSYVVTLRRREMGIRMALGAARTDVMGLILRRGLAQTAIGVSLGLLAALAGGRIVGGLLVGVEGHDPLTLAVVPLAMTAVALLAAFLPARRASLEDPLSVLRQD